MALDVVLVAVVRLPGTEDLPLPAYETAGASGMDLRAAVVDPVRLGPGETLVVPTGITLEIPEGFEAQVRPRSGLAVRHGVTVVNAPGTIDSDYRGEISVALINLGQAAFELRRGDRIAQMVFTRVSRARLEIVSTLSSTPRGAGGFGHTGT